MAAADTATPDMLSPQLVQASIQWTISQAGQRASSQVDVCLRALVPKGAPDDPSALAGSRRR